MAWENSRHFATPSDWFPREMTSKQRAQKFHTADTSPYQDLGSASDWLKITLSNQTHYPDLGSDVSAVWKFCALCSDIISRLIVPKRKGNFVKFPAQKRFGIRVRVELENYEYLWKFSRYTFCFCFYIEIVTASKPFFKRNWKQFFSRSYSQYNTSSFVTCFRPSSFDCVDIDADCLYSRWWNTWICSWRLVSKQGAFFDRHKLETFGHIKQALLAISGFNFRMAWRIMQIAIDRYLSHEAKGQGG